MIVKPMFVDLEIRSANGMIAELFIFPIIWIYKKLKVVK